MVTNFLEKIFKIKFVVTNLVFVRKKKIKGKEYYYLVNSTRKNGKIKKFERYLGINPPQKEDMESYSEEFDLIKEFLSANKSILEKIKQDYRDKLKNGTKDELRKIEENIVIKFTYDSSRIEGSSLSYKDTDMLLKEGISPKEKPMRDIKETENLKEAYDYMKKNLKKEINNELILKLHEILKKDITEDAGKFRNGQVRVADLIPVNHKMVSSEISNLLLWYKKNKDIHPLELSSVFHCIFERIHPFFDGNGRVGRLLLNYILLKKNYPVIIIQNKNKKRYYNALRRADGGNYLYMIKYLFSELIKQDYYSK